MNLGCETTRTDPFTKLLRYGLLTLACIGLAAPLAANAQGTLYLSHLGSSADTGEYVQSDRWSAISFETGVATNGYSLDSMQLRITGIAGSPSGFELSLYNNNGSVPGNSLELLSGSDPTGAGIYTFTASGITLSPSTVYWAVTTSSDSSLSGNSFYWALDPNSYTSSDGWSLSTTGDYGSSDHGASWYNGGGSPFTLAVYATAVPEPVTTVMLTVSTLASSNVQIISSCSPPVSQSTFVLQSTTDFVNWTGISTNIVVGGFMVTNIIQTTNLMIFYRGKLF
jgi:hypothetical protein